MSCNSDDLNLHEFNSYKRIPVTTTVTQRGGSNLEGQADHDHHSRCLSSIKQHHHQPLQYCY